MNRYRAWCLVAGCRLRLFCGPLTLCHVHRFSNRYQDLCLVAGDYPLDVHAQGWLRLCECLWRTHRAAQRRTTFLEATAEVGSCQGGSGSQLLRPVRGHAWLACAALFVMTSILHVPSPTMSGDVRGPSPVWGPVWGLGSKVARKAWSDLWSGIGLWLQGVQPLFFGGSCQDAFT